MLLNFFLLSIKKLTCLKLLTISTHVLFSFEVLSFSHSFSNNSLQKSVCVNPSQLDKSI